MFTRIAIASDKFYQLLAHGRWFSPGTLAFSTTKPGRHDIAEILLKVALNTINQIKYSVTSILYQLDLTVNKAEVPGEIGGMVFNTTFNNIRVQGGYG